MKVYICDVDGHDSDTLIEKYPCLNEFGFIVEETERTCRIPIRDENHEWIMSERVRVFREPHIVLESLEDLAKLYEAVGVELIFRVDGDGTYVIEIYDGYRE